MKKISKLITMLLLILVISGCTGRIVHMKDKRGTHITCEVSTLSTMMTGVLVRNHSIDNCVNQKKVVGFKVVYEE